MAIFYGVIMSRSFVCIFFCFLTACSIAQPAKPEYTAVFQDVVKHDQESIQAHMIDKAWEENPFPGATLMGFISDKERWTEPSKRSIKGDIHLEEGQPLDYYLSLNVPETTTVLVSILLDYKQIEFELAGKKALLHEFVAEPGGDLDLPIRLDVEGEGLHDLMAIAFKDPYNMSLDVDYRSSLHGRISGARVAVIVGQNDQPAKSLEPILEGKAVQQDINLRLGVVFATASKQGHPADLDHQLYIAQAKAGTVFDFQIWVSNQGIERAYEYTSLLFLDFHQQPIQGREVLPVYLEPDEEAIFDESVQLSQQPGIYQMQLVHILDPYRSIDKGEVDAPFVFGSPRIAIDTRP